MSIIVLYFKGFFNRGGDSASDNIYCKPLSKGHLRDLRILGVFQTARYSPTMLATVRSEPAAICESMNAF